MHKVIMYFLFMSFCNLLAAQKHTSKSFPFILTEYNNISVKSVLNKKDTAQLMFHTAANAITLTEGAIKKLNTVKFTETTDSVKSWGGQANSARLSKHNQLKIGGLEWNELSIWENVNSGQFTDGKFGIDLFVNQVIEIDFDKSIITISNKLPAKARNYERLSLIRKDDNLFLQADCKVERMVCSNLFLLHSGYSGSVLLDDQFVALNYLDEKLAIVGEKTLKDSYGNTIKTKKAILPLFSFGKQVLANVPVGFFEGAIGRQKMSIIGGDVLKRYNIIISADRAFIYLKPNKFNQVAYSNK